MSALDKTDPEIAALIRQEERYQLETLRLIPSENYASAAVIEAMGSVLANKYSEGAPGKRYYEGQRYIDQLEALVQERATRSERSPARWAPISWPTSRTSLGLSWP